MKNKIKLVTMSIIFMFILVTNVSASPSITTDKADYAPEEIVTIYGMGFVPGDINLAVTRPDGVVNDITNVVADETGSFTTTYQLDGITGTYTISVTDSSGQNVQTTFTDGTVTVAPIIIYKADCTNVQTIFTQGDVVCAKSTITVSGRGTGNLAIQWFDPNNNMVSDILFQGQSNGATVVGTFTTTITDTTGTWTIKTCKGAPTTPCSGPSTLDTKTFTLNAPSDTTPPVISPTVSGTKGANDWYISDVPVSWTVSDPESPVSSSSGCGTTNINTDTSGTTFTCTATSAGGTNSQSITIKRDATPPTASLSVVAGTLGTNGWYTSDVTVSTTGSDSVSGPVTCTADQYVTGDTIGAIFNGKCTNGAGLSTDAAPLTVKLDETGPSANLVATGITGANGWYIGDVTIGTSGTDSISSPVSCTADQFQTIETTGAVFNGKCTNDAGLSTDAEPLTIKLDKTGPSASLSVIAGTLGSNGWYTSDVTVSVSGTDSISSPVTCSVNQFQTTDTVGTVFNGACTNDAGLKTDASPLTVKLDKTPPVVTASADRFADHNGWYNNPVTVSFSGTDVLPGSGIDSCDPSVIYSTDSATASVSGTCKDNAGNIGTGTLNFKYDSSPPTATLAVISGTQGLNDWYTSAVVVSMTGSDSVSSPVTCTGVQSFTTETTGITVTGSCTNDAGLSTNAALLNLKIDLGPPIITISTHINGANYILNQVVTANYNCVDTISGVASCVGTVANGANIDTSSVGTKTFTVKSTDNAGEQGQQQYQYNVIYAFGGILQPINRDGSSIFKLGSTIPVKFQLTDYGGNYISTAVATISVAKIDNNVEGTYVEAVSTSAATTGNLFRYDSTSNQYIFNWGTKGLTTGTWNIKISINDGTTYTVKISLK